MDVATEGQASSRNRSIREQVEYYLSDRNLGRDNYFRDLVEADLHGWISADPHILQCPKIQQLSVGSQELAEVLQASEVLEVEVNLEAPWICRVRRKHLYRREDGKTTRQSKCEGKGTAKGKRRDHDGLRYDLSTPCGYFMAGYCRHGDKCIKQHSVTYALAIRHEWLHPEDNAGRRLLQKAAEQALGPDWVASNRLFPRVFSQKLNAKKTKAADVSHDISDLGFSWEKEGESQAQALQHSSQPIRYLLVLDLEGKDEITEFPVIAIDSFSRCELGRFQQYVRPVHLFDNCTLTESSPAIAFTEVLIKFDEWLRLTLGRSLSDMGHVATDMAFVTCGDWDCKHVHTQCNISGVAVPAAFSQWINIKRVYDDFYGGEFRGMKSMLSRLRLLDPKGDPKFGFHHLGMHDVENIGRCLMHLLEMDAEILINGWKK